MMAPLFGLPPEELETYPHACIGTVDEICESLEMRRERWDASLLRVPGRHDGAAGSGGRQAPRHLSRRWVPSPRPPPRGWTGGGTTRPACCGTRRARSRTSWSRGRCTSCARRPGTPSASSAATAPGDRARAEAALTAVVDHQYDEPGQPWHGTFVRFPEWAPPTRGRRRVDRLRPELAPVPRHRARRGGHRLRPVPRPLAATGPRRRPPRRRRRSRRIGCRRPTPTSRCCAPGWTRGPADADDGYAQADRRRLPAPRLLHRVRLPHLLRHRPAGARPLAARRRADGAATRRRRIEAALWTRHRPVVARRAREPVRPVLPGVRHGPRRPTSAACPWRCGAPACPRRCHRWRPTSCRTATTSAWRRCSSTSACGCPPPLRPAFERFPGAHARRSR